MALMFDHDEKIVYCDELKKKRIIFTEHLRISAVLVFEGRLIHSSQVSCILS